MAAYFSDVESENPSLFDYNVAFVRYCDGGSYAGNADVEVNDKILHFRGMQNRKATIHDLLVKHGMGNASEVLISGCSAGGLGVLLGIDDIAADIERFAGTPIPVKGLVDSGFFVDYSYGQNDFESKKHNYQEALTPTGALDYAYAMRNVFEFMNLSAGADPDCLASQIATGQPPSSCIFAEVVGKYIQTPLFFLQSQYDSWQMWHVMGKSSNTTAVNEFGGKLKLAIRNLVATSAEGGKGGVSGQTKSHYPQHGAFVDSCEHHCMSCNHKTEHFWANASEMASNGLGLADAFSKWYNKKPASDEPEPNEREGYYFAQDEPFPCPSCCTCTHKYR